MSFITRIPTAVRYTLFGKSAVDLLPVGSRGQAVYPIANFESNVINGFRRNELIYACEIIKADSVSAAKLTIERSSGKILDSHPLLDLIRTPNPYMTEFDLLGSILIHQDLAGNSYWEKVRSRAGKVVQLWPLRPDWVLPVQNDASAGLKYYEYRVPGIPPIRLDPQDVLDFKLNDPMNMYRGSSPISVASRVAAVDNSTTDFIKLFLQEGGSPPGILASKLKLQDEAVADIRRRWKESYGGYNKWTQPAVLDSDASYQRTGLTFAEMAFPDQDARNEARVCMVLRVPPAMIGAKVGLDRNTFSNADQQEKDFWRHYLIPQLKRIKAELASDLLPEFGAEKLTLNWDLSEVLPLQEDEKAKWERATAAVTSGAFSVNMFLEYIGKEQIGPPGDVFLRTSSLQAIPIDALPPDPAEIAAQAEAMRQQISGGNNPDGNGDNMDNANGDGMPGGNGNGNGNRKAIIPPNAPNDRERRRHEKAIATAAEEFLSGQMGRLKELLAV